MDSGIAHLGTISKEQFNNDIKTILYNYKIGVILMKGIGNVDLKTYLQYNKGIVEATYFVVPKNLCECYYLEIDNIFKFAVDECKLFWVEGQLQGYLVGKYLEKFEYIFGDYINILKNIRWVCTSMDNVIKNLAHCRFSNLN